MQNNKTNQQKASKMTVSAEILRLIECVSKLGWDYEVHPTEDGLLYLQLVEVDGTPARLLNPCPPASAKSVKRYLKGRLASIPAEVRAQAYAEKLERQVEPMSDEEFEEWMASGA